MHATWRGRISRCRALLIIVPVVLVVGLSVWLGLTPSVSAQSAGTCPADAVAYWKLDETAGPPFVDGVGGHNATCATGDCPQATAGRVAGALAFDGVDDALHIPHDAAFDWGNADAFSIEAWIKSAVATGAQAILGKQGSESSYWRLDLADGRARFVLQDSAGTAFEVESAAGVGDGAWHHLAAVRDASNELRLYVDGVLTDTQTTTYTGDFANGGAVVMGAQGGVPFAGQIDEVAVYDRALPDSEVARHHQDGRVGLQWGYCGCAAYVRIMPLGDSITKGTYGSEETRPDEEIVGYRQPLYINLEGSGRYVDFVGSMQAGQAATPPFDPDHEGDPGRTDHRLARDVYNYLTAHPADVVLLHIGTNNLSPDPGDVARILDEIDRFDPGITVVLARIINRRTYSQGTTTFNDNVEAMALARIQNGDKIIIVDQEGALDYATDMADNIHPNDSGYTKMATVWGAALDGFLPLCTDTPPPPPPTPTAVPTATATPTPTATPGPGVPIAFTSEADTYINEATPTQNFGSTSQLRVGGASDRSESYLRFNVTGIPANVTITDARLVLEATNGSVNQSEPFELYSFAPTDPQWNETSPTWSAPLAGSPGPLLATVTGQINAGSQITFAGLEGEVTGNGRYTFYLVTERTDGTAFASREAPAPDAAPQLEVTYQEPLAVELELFEAVARADHVTVNWSTVWEVDNLGFHLYRGTSASGPDVRLTETLLPSQAPGSGQGASYTYADYAVEAGTTYYYWLEDRAGDGRTTRHGPVSTLLGSPTAVAVSHQGAAPPAVPWRALVAGVALLGLWVCWRVWPRGVGTS